MLDPLDEPWVPVHRVPSSSPHCLAVCAELGVLVTSSTNAAGLTMWSLPKILQGVPEEEPGCLDLVGDLTCVAFFIPPMGSGTPTPLLLVSNYANGAVHIVDVVSRSRKDDLAPPGSMKNYPLGVASNMGLSGPSSMVAVTTTSDLAPAHPITLFRWCAASNTWRQWREIGAGLLDRPRSLRFNADGTVLCVADKARQCLSLFRVSDSYFIGRLTTGEHDPMDMQEVEGGWMVACWRRAMVHVKSDGSGLRPLQVDLDEKTWEKIWGCALVPGLGIALSHGIFGVTIYASASVAAMRRMSAARVVWMAAVATASGM